MKAQGIWQRDFSPKGLYLQKRILVREKELFTGSAEGFILSLCGLVASIPLPKADLYFTDICPRRVFVVFSLCVLQLVSAVGEMLCWHPVALVPLTLSRSCRCHTCSYLGSLHLVPERGRASRAENVGTGNTARPPLGAGQGMWSHGWRGFGQLLR